MSRQDYDNYDQEDFSYHAADHSASDSINSETMEKKDPAINQHEDSSQRHKYSEDHFESDDNTVNHHSEENTNDTSDPFFQKNAPIAQDLDEELKNEKDDDFDNDANRRTLDEEKADEDDDDDY
ncbi:hypothetical protein [Flavobacterium sp. DG2-3]|uniref:hypothetical protein n=1 Tax=Flavobacterium sp. DG2-3 TaxID=3068317 RepID=UPI00273F873A|nr:hypothetical protein [Flavobacterium sp. DG2-3]MDP5199058.1 hypothetical protein [Flavobacterium sp. DG2-3]